MIKKVVLLILATLLIVTGVYAADESRWIPVEGAYKTWFDKNTVTYDRKTGDIIYWTKFVPQDGIDLLKEYKVNIYKKNLMQIYEVKEGPGNKHTEINGYRRGYMRISPDSAVEREANLACDILSLKPILESKSHTWKYLKTVDSEVGPGMEYICTDVFIYNPEKQSVHVYLKSVYANNRYVKYEADVKLQERMVERILGKGRIAAPDTLEEAIYNETMKMVNKHENH